MRPAGRTVLGSWLLFFLICVGLGYPTLNRYDPRTAGNPDSAEYYRLVVTWPLEPSERGRYRVLIPYVAKPFRWLAMARLGSWDPVFFGLLVANAFFSAATASLLLSLGTRALGNPAVAWLGATLFLLNFAVPNLFLAGHVDSGEAFVLTALTWALLGGRLWILPMLGPLGVLARETFLPLSLAFALGWHFCADRRPADTRRLLAIAGLTLGGAAALIAVQSAATGALAGPWLLRDLQRSQVSYLTGLWRCVTDRGFWYVFGWLLPLGLLAVGRLPRAWVGAAATAAVTALLLGAWIDSQGNIARPVFSAAGPLLSLSAAAFLVRSSNASSDRCLHLGSPGDAPDYGP